MDITWLCPIPGSDPATAAWHAALMLGLAGFVVIGGAIFLILAVLAYRGAPDRASDASPSTVRTPRFANAPRP
jgi:hypothetical protein